MKIDHIDQLLPLVADRKEFLVLDQGDYKVIDYRILHGETFDHPGLLECRGIKFRADGSLQRSDNGIWWAEHDRLCRRFGNAYSGHRVCHRVLRDGALLKIIDERGNLVSRITLE